MEEKRLAEFTLMHKNSFPKNNYKERLTLYKNLAFFIINVTKEDIALTEMYYSIFQPLDWEVIIISEIISNSNEFTVLGYEVEVDVTFKLV